VPKFWRGRYGVILPFWYFLVGMLRTNQPHNHPVPDTYGSTIYPQMGLQGRHARRRLQLALVGQGGCTI